MTDHLPADFLEAARTIVGADDLLTEAGAVWPYGYDNSRRHHPPAAVAFPREQAQVVELVRLCNRHRIPLVPRGAGTATTGATVPLEGGLVLALERMKRIINLDPDNRVMVVEPGVTNREIQQAAGKHGFFWPPDPTSSPVCTVGGNLAVNSAGPRAVKYGATWANTLGLKAITGDGREIHAGVYTTKGVVGYDLTRLLIGSEGTLAVITEATLKLTPLAEARRTIQAVYRDIASAAAAVSRIMAQPVTPSALEFMDGTAIGLVRDYAGATIPLEAGALLMIEADGPSGHIGEAVAAIRAAAEGEGLLEFKAAESEAEVRELWETRRALSPAQRRIAPKKINEDVVVPVSRIPQLIGGLEALAAEYRVTIVNFGHAGNGNIHVNLLVNPDDEKEMTRAHACLDRVFTLVLELGGTLSGEHGVGIEKRDYIQREIDPPTLELMRAIKRQFDPNGILNPGKLFPEAPYAT
ncbi:FAD-binding oxidoreductase [Endothiovibrio diazotrophicus]